MTPQELRGQFGGVVAFPVTPFRADLSLDLEGLRARFAGRLRIAMNGEADAKKLQQLLAPYRASGGGTCQVVVAYRNSTAACEVALGDTWRVRPDSRLIAELGAWLTPANVQLVYSTGAVALAA